MPEDNLNRACSYSWKAVTKQGRLSTRLQLTKTQFKVAILGAATALAVLSFDLSFSTSSILTTVYCPSEARHAQITCRGSVTERNASQLGKH